MALLTPEQIKRILTDGISQPLQEELNSCRKHDIRARFHIETTLEPVRLEYKTNFLTWIGTMLAKEKMQVFEHLLTLPIETVEFTEGVFDELTKVFEAQDRHIEYAFTNPELANDYTRFLAEVGDPTFWQTRGFHAMKTAINSIAIVDLPAVQLPGDRFAQPYYYLLDVQKVVAFNIDQSFNLEFIAFYNRYDRDILHIFDDGFYRTYIRASQNKQPGDNIARPDVWVLSNEIAHDLGYTPARSFWTTPFEQNSRIQKRGPQSNSLGKFDWLLALYTFLKHTELYAGFPIDVVYESRCDYRDAQDGATCNGGKIYRMIPQTIGGPPTVPQVSECPKCKDRKSLGPGLQIIAPAMASKDDPDMLKGMNRIGADKISLEYLINRIQTYEADISTNMIGYVAENIREAMNKEQVASQLEGRINCLSEVRDNFQAIHHFVLETMARLRYGPNALLSVTCNYGNKWFIHSVEKLQQQYKESKENGFAQFELSAQFGQILLTKYKNNPSMLRRTETLIALEPYQNYTIADLKTLQDSFGLREDLVHLKIDFHRYIGQFEREYTNLGDFMQFMPFEVKVAFVMEKLLEYVDEDFPEEEEPEPPPIPPPGTPPLPGGQPPIPDPDLKEE